MELTTQQNHFKIELKQLEDDLLSRLSAACGHFLGDVSLVEQLESTKTTAAHIQLKVRPPGPGWENLVWFFFLYKWLPNKASFCCITCKWYESRKMCNESDLEHDWEPHCSLCAFGTRRWWRPERTRQRSTRLENYTAQQLREHHSSSSSSVTSAGLTPCISILSRWNLDLWGGWKGTNVAFLFQYIYIWNIVTPYSDKTLTIYCEADVKRYLLS